MKPTAYEHIDPAAPAEEAFLAGLRRDLDKACEDLPPGLRARLRERRALALAPPTRSWHQVWLAPVGGALAMSVLAVVLLFDSGGLMPASPAPLEALEDLDILAAGEELDMLEEFEFYQWLADSATP